MFYWKHMYISNNYDSLCCLSGQAVRVLNYDPQIVHVRIPHKIKVVCFFLCVFYVKNHVLFISRYHFIYNVLCSQYSYVCDKQFGYQTVGLACFSYLHNL